MLPRPFADIRVPTLHAVVAGHAAARPGAAAIRYKGDVLTYGQVNRMANRFAADLRQRGIGANARIIFLGRNSAALPLFALGANKAGVVPVPINWRLAPAEVRSIVQDCAPRLIVAETDYLDAAERMSRETPFPVSVVAAATLTDQIDDEAAAVDLATDSEAIAIQVYTSGSTGHPKGVMLSHRALNGVNLLRPTLDWENWSARDVALVQGPLGHIGAYGMMMRALFFGGCAVIHDGFDAAATLEAIEKDRITKLALVPTAIKMLLDLPEARDADYGSLDTIIYGSAPIARTLLERAMETFGCGFAQSYGQTETTGPTVVLTPDDHREGRLASVGRPMPATEIRIRKDTGLIAPAGVTGEIQIRSIANMSGYWNLPDETAQTLGADGWISTGDAGFIDEEGYVFLRGRVKEMIITGAENVFPGEVEAVLSAHRDVAEVAVFGLPDPHWGEAVAAAIVPRPGSARDGDAIRRWARERLAGYKLPKAIHFLPELPLNATGKIDKRRIAAELPASQGGEN